MVVMNESTATFLAVLLANTIMGVIPMIDKKEGVTEQHLDLVIV